MPWNFPLWQAVRFAAPGLMAGNVGLLKHASNVPQTALYLGELFGRRGFPPGAFQTLLIGSARVEAVIRDRRVAAVTLTGSGPAGSAVGAVAGEMIKPSVLELGGSDAFVVMPSADLERAAAVATTARCQNNGQSCIAAKRFIVHEAVADEFERRFVEKMSALSRRRPRSTTRPTSGPWPPSRAATTSRSSSPTRSRRAPRCSAAASGWPAPGWYYPPTVLSGITPEMRMYTEEVFGPVAALFRVGGVEEAIELANDDRVRARRERLDQRRGRARPFRADLEAGMVFLNGMVTSYPELPFGGIKTSGYGRELSAQGIRAFCNLKTVWVGES